MRIRKHAKISSLMLSHASTSSPSLQTPVCQLNQSPWDVITFPSDSTSLSCLPSFSFLLQSEEEESVTANGSLGDSIGAVESVASMRISPDSTEEEKPNPKTRLYPTLEKDTAKKREKIIADEHKLDTQFEFIRGGGGETMTNSPTIALCSKSDGRGWHCKREAKQGHTLCEHHLAQLRSYTASRPSSRKTEKTVASGVAITSHSTATTSCPRPNRKKPLISTNPHEFYYYSGFGPWWGKKRGGSTGGESNKTTVSEATAGTVASFSSQINRTSDKTKDLDFVEDDNDDREGNDDGRRKRTRKPVKARSLKSLM
ncbi:uncharacterized protein LOC131166834 [Malania oleifera]|uniref:uncharacterized protein LOC131166834 n=1 Tax=Malania oleifera TaxID=397392 RepID=UPI0025AE2BD2|nr:uncharacterized protein LOC131166834 [Malania oleifera]